MRAHPLARVVDASCHGVDIVAMFAYVVSIAWTLNIATNPRATMACSLHRGSRATFSRLTCWLGVTYGRNMSPSRSTLSKQACILG